MRDPKTRAIDRQRFTSPASQHHGRAAPQFLFDLCRRGPGYACGPRLRSASYSRFCQCCLRPATRVVPGGGGRTCRPTLRIFRDAAVRAFRGHLFRARRRRIPAGRWLRQSRRTRGVGRGPLAAMPFWLQAVLYLVIQDVLMYWSHRAFHTARLWRYHAVHHSSVQLDWLSGRRFHPVDFALHSAFPDAVCLMLGISPDLHIPRAVQRMAFGAGARQPQLVVGPAEICADQSGFPPLASHRHGTGRHEEFRGNLSGARFDIRDFLYAQERHAR